jgi:hypothetical protein
MPIPVVFRHAQPLDHRSWRWAWLFLAGVLMSSPSRSQELDFARDCMRVTGDGLILDTSPVCLGAFRTDPAARAQFVQLIQLTLSQAEAAQREARPGTTPAQALRRLFDKASLEPGRVVGVGGTYYGAQ